MMFTQCIGGESMRDGVRVVGINPGPIMSDRHRRGAERVAERELGSKDRWPEFYKRFPIGRPGRVEEVANVVGIPRFGPRLLYQRRNRPHRCGSQGPRSGLLMLRGRVCCMIGDYRCAR